MKHNVAPSHCADPFTCKVSLPERITQQSPFPLAAVLVLTDRCLLSCPHCYEPRKNGGADLSIEEWIGVMDQLADAGTLYLVLTGGDPPLRPDFFDLLEAARNRRYAVSLKTSGISLNAEDVKRCWDLGLSNLEVSLYHDLAGDHDRFVGFDGALFRTTGTLRAFKKLGGKAKVNVLAMNWNADRVSNILDQCDDEGWSYSVDCRVDRRLDGHEAPIRFLASEQQLIDLLTDPRLNPKDRLVKQQAPSSTDPLCGAGKSGICIRPNGDVWPCLMLPCSMGNLRVQSYVDIIAGSKLLKQIAEVHWEDDERCATCRKSWICSRCPGSAFLEHGDISRASSLDCFLASAFAGAAQRDDDDQGRCG